MKTTKWNNTLTGSYLELAPWMHLRLKELREQYEVSPERIRTDGFRGEHFEHAWVSADNLEEAKNMAVLWAIEHLKVLQERLEVER